jgi:hypothetical protein
MELDLKPQDSPISKHPLFNTTIHSWGIQIQVQEFNNPTVKSATTVTATQPALSLSPPEEHEVPITRSFGKTLVLIQ